ELGRLASLLESGLLALDGAGVAREEAGLLQGRPVVLTVDLVERAGDAEAQGASLAGGATTNDAGDHVVAADEVENLEGVVDELLVQLVGEVVGELAAVDREVAGSRDEAHASNRTLAATNGGTRNVEHGAGRRGGLGGSRFGRVALDAADRGLVDGV